MPLGTVAIEEPHDCDVAEIRVTALALIKQLLPESEDIITSRLPGILTLRNKPPEPQPYFTAIVGLR